MNMFVSTAAMTALPTPVPALSEISPDDRRRLDAMLARAEEVVNLMRTCHVRDGWQMDEAAAARALEYFRKSAADGSDDEELREEAIEFLSSHGQSLDWVFCGDPGGMICRLAGQSDRATVLARPAGGDEALWSLYKKFSRAYDKMKRLDTSDSQEGSLPSRSTSAQQAAFKKWERASSAAFKAAQRVLALPAYTGDGLLMKIHVAGFEFDADRGSFAMPYRGMATAPWTADRFAVSGASAFIASIGNDLRRANLAA